MDARDVDAIGVGSRHIRWIGRTKQSGWDSRQNSVIERGAEITQVSGGHHTVVADTGNRGEPDCLLGRRDKCPICAPRYTARWRGYVFGHPLIQRDEKSP